MRNTLFENFSRRGISFFSIYLFVCLMMSVPVLSYVWDILYSNPVPEGGDPADHALFTLKILDTGDPRIEYTQFPSLSSEQNPIPSYYPSFLHLLIAFPSYFMQLIGISPFTSVIFSMSATMLASYIIGIIGYALVSYLFLINIISEYHAKINNITIRALILLMTAILVWGIFLYSTSPILKTFRDGSYGEILSLWTILPWYVLCLFRSRWIIAGILFGVIASTHNISLVLALAATLAFLISLLVGKEWRQIKKLWKLGFTAALSSIPAFIYFYYPVIVAALSQETGLSGQTAIWNRADIAGQIGNVLYYFGIIAVIGLLFISYRKSSWLVTWVLLYLIPFYFNIFFLERLAREFSIPVGLSLANFTGTIVFIIITKFYPRIASKIGVSKNRVPVQQALICLALTLVVILVYYNVYAPRFEMFGLPLVLSYYSDSLSESNKFLLDSGQDENATVASFGVNPWIKPYSYGKLSILEVETADVEKSLSRRDSRVNAELRSIIEDPNSDKAERALRQFGVKYLFLSDTLEGRWYSDAQKLLVSKFPIFEETYDKSKISLERQWRGAGGEILQIYKVHLN